MVWRRGEGSTGLDHGRGTVWDKFYTMAMVRSGKSQHESCLCVSKHGTRSTIMGCSRCNRSTHFVARSELWPDTADEGKRRRRLNPHCVAAEREDRVVLHRGGRHAGFVQPDMACRLVRRTDLVTSTARFASCPISERFITFDPGSWVLLLCSSGAECAITYICSLSRRAGSTRTPSGLHMVIRYTR